MSARGCDAAGCDRPHRARGLCAQHWKRAYGKPERHPRVCESCGDSFLSSRPTGRFCSLRCRDEMRRQQRLANAPVTPTEVVRWTQPAAEPSTNSNPQVWVAGWCAWCGIDFVVHASAGRYCSGRCLRRRSRARRRALERGALGTYTWSEVTRKWITIGRACAYCRTPLANADVEPDHVHPLSRGGSNSIVNVVPCCRSCNVEKGALLLGEWQQKRVAAGLPPRTLHPRLTIVSSLS